MASVAGRFLAAFIAVTVSAAPAAESTALRRVRDFMNPQEFKDSGLDKLSDKELESLDRWLNGIVDRAFVVGRERDTLSNAKVEMLVHPAAAGQDSSSPVLKSVGAADRMRSSGSGLAQPKFAPGEVTIDRAISGNIVADDGFVLGVISANKTDPTSVSNEIGQYGSPVGRFSIFNESGQYGGETGRFSPFNKTCLAPPKIFVDGKLLCYLTVNPAKTPRIDPRMLKSWLATRR